MDIEGENHIPFKPFDNLTANPPLVHTKEYLKPNTLEHLPTITGEILNPHMAPNNMANQANPSTEMNTQNGENRLNNHDLSPSLKRNFYRFRKKVIKFFGGSFDLYDEHDKKVLYSHQKEFRLREDFRLYEDASRTKELLKISTGDIFDFHATFHVDDSKTNERVGSLKREWLQSTMRDEWTFLGPDGKKIIGKMQEKSAKRAFFSRLLGPLFVPQQYAVTTPDGTIVAEVKQHRNPFVLKYDMNILLDNPTIDRRLLITSGILLSGIEGRQESWAPSSSSSSFSLDTTTA